MKKNLFAVAIAVACGSAAHAQSNVVLYGLIDSAVRYTSNANPTGDNKLELNAGSLSGNRWGMRGSEDLGGGLKGIFTLEGGFNVDAGTQAQNALFGRQAFVGVESGFGTVTFGRQQTIGYDIVGTFMPVGWTNLSDEINWASGLTGQRVDNAIKYRGSFSDLKVSALYAFGEAVGNNTKGNQWGASLGYASGPLAANAFYQRSTDGLAAKLVTMGVGGSYAFGPAKLFAGYVRTDADKGFDGSTTSVSSTLSNASLAKGFSVDRKDNLLLAGVTYAATPATNLTLAYQYDKAKDVSAGKDGTRSTLYALANYNLSKRTDVYFLVDANRTKDALVGSVKVDGSSSDATLGIKGAGAKDTRTGVSIGLRHRF